MPVATTDDGVEVAWQSTGRGPPIVLIHGVTENRHLWQPIAEPLSASFRVIGLDLRGHGESGRASDYTYTAMARDVAAVVDAAEANRPTLIGHSLGALVATAYASQHDVEAVVNIDLSLDTRPIAARIRGLEAALRGSAYTATLRAMLATLAGDQLPDATLQAIDYDATRAPQDVVLGVYDTLLHTSDNELLRMAEDLMDNLDAPYLLLHGAQPDQRYVAWVRGHLQNVTIQTWPEAGHFLHLTDPARFVRTVVEFRAMTTG